jgi:adenine-specific DNA-methyltransferase
VPETSITIPIIKASTGKWARCLYPYDRSGQPIPEKQLFADVVVKDYFVSHKAELLKDNPEYPGWFYFGRTQALKDVYTTKYAINSLVRDVNSIKLNLVPAGSGVYSGLYILTDVDEKKLRSLVECQEFVEYIASLKCYKSGGYYTFNSKDLEQYLNYKLSKEGIKVKSKTHNYEQPSLFDCY